MCKNVIGLISPHRRKKFAVKAASIYTLRLINAYPSDVYVHLSTSMCHVPLFMKDAELSYDEHSSLCKACKFSLKNQRKMFIVILHIHFKAQNKNNKSEVLN